MDIAVAGRAFGAECSEGLLGMGRVAGQGLVDLFIDDNVDVYATFSSTLQDLVEAPFLGKVRRSAQEKLGRQPPIHEVDCFLCSFEGDGHGVKVVAAVNVPLDLVSVSFGGETLEAVTLANLCPLFVRGLLVLFVVTVVGVDEVLPFANLVLCVDRLHLDVVQGRLLHFLSQIRKRVLDVVAGALMLCVGRVASLLLGLDVRRLSNETHLDV